LATTAPEKRSGRQSSHSTRDSKWGCGGNRLLLPLAQIGRQIEYAVALGQAAQPLQFEQQVGRQAAGAGPHLKHRGGRGGEHRFDLPGQRPAEQGDISGAVTKSPAAPNLRAPAV
jgi:hypothetical protein